MTIFKESTNKTTTIKTLTHCLPTILIKPDALIKMQIYVENCADEVGWLGTAYELKNSIYIDDVFLFEQEVHSTTTEITPEGLSEFGEAILQQHNGMDIWNNLKVWGHSHVNMSISPSSQDDKQMETFSEGGHDWFIRIIANKKGEIRLDLYNYQLGIIYNDMPWYEAMNEEEIQIREQINILEKYLEDIKNKLTSEYDTIIKKEINEKVKKKYSYNNSYTTSTTYGTTTKDMNTSTKGSVINIPKKNEEKTTKEEKETKKVTTKYTTGCITEVDDVFDWFGINEMCELGVCTNIKDMEEVLVDLGYHGVFDEEEMELILIVCNQELRKYYAKLAREKSANEVGGKYSVR